MSTATGVVLALATFGLIALASKEIGRYFVRRHLPLISGFLLAGIVAGPYVLGLISEEAVADLQFIEQAALAYIAFAAGNELYLPELRSRIRSISFVSAGLVIATFIGGTLVVFFLSDLIPFIREFTTTGRLAVALLAGAILVARSPSSAIAIVNELRAKGPFTRTVLGVTVISDVVVIVIFAISLEAAGALLTDIGLNLGFVLLLIFEFALALAIGLILSKLLELVLSGRLNTALKGLLIVALGFGIFALSDIIREVSHERLPFEVFLEPLLICMIASFLITNRSSSRAEFGHALHDLSFPVYIAFFTLTGAGLAIDVLADTWFIALILFGVRLITIFIGAFSGGVAAGEPMAHNKISWMAYVTQAGVGLGLAAEVSVEFSGWGAAFATTMISIIILNQLVGPPLFKWAIQRAGEAHPHATPAAFDGINDTLIFGLEGQSLALARQLRQHGWQSRIVCFDADYAESLPPTKLDVRYVPAVTVESLRELGADKADAIVTLLTDEQNYAICEMVYENFGIENVITRLTDHTQAARFHELGVLVVEPATAIVSLMDHFVRSPAAVSLLLGLEEDQDVADLHVLDRDLDGLALRDLRLPDDTLIMAVQRDGHTIISHGYTRVRVGDLVTVVGSPESLNKVALRLAE